MKNQIINEIQRKMLPYLNNEQLLHLKAVLEASFQGVIIEMGEEQPKAEEQDSAAAFITAKRIEGCSEKTLAYYSKTIEAMLNGVGKLPQQITTDDLRKYLTDYQTQRHSSKVTIDNIRRILSSFFSWLEDEDFIVKSPVRRIHKVKTAKIIKETYTDEALELMRDHCSTVRDLAIIDLLASSGMRVGEMVTLNREDINFNERECVVFGKGNKERLVYFDARTKIHLQNYLDERADSNPALFVTLKAPHERLMIGGVETMLGVIKLRGVLAPGGHVAWAAIEGAALMFAKGFDKLSKKHLNDKRFLLVCLIPIVLHGIWDMPINAPMYLVPITLTVLAWVVIVYFINLGLKQVDEAKRLEQQGQLPS